MPTDINKLYYGYNAPFFGGHQNVLSRQAGIRLIKNDLTQLVMTLPGERIMRPDWGTTLRTLVFENASDSDFRAVADSITTAIQTYDPRVDATVEYTVDEDNHKVTYRVTGYIKEGAIVPFELLFEVK